MAYPIIDTKHYGKVELQAVEIDAEGNTTYEMYNPTHDEYFGFFISDKFPSAEEVDNIILDYRKEYKV